MLLSVGLPQAAGAETQPYSVRIRPYTLTGSAGLFYLQEWSDTANKQQFSQDYRLNLKGFIIDRRLIKYDVISNFSHRWDSTDSGYMSSGNNYNFGIGANITFLINRPLLGPFRFVPQPVTFNFNYGISNTSDTYGYGIAMSYSLPLNLVFFRDGKVISLGRPGEQSSVQEMNVSDSDNNENNNNDNNSDNNNNSPKMRQSRGYSIPFPEFFVSYNSYSYNNRTTGQQQYVDYFNLRSYAATSKIRYIFNYRFNNSESSSGSSNKMSGLSLNIDYYNYNQEKAQSSSLNNYISHETHNNLSMTRISSIGRWTRRFGDKLRDSIAILGAANYFNNDEGSTYSGMLTGMYSHTVPLYSNVLIGTLNAGADMDSGASARLTDSFIYNLSGSSQLRSVLGWTMDRKNSGYNLYVGYRRQGRVITDAIYSYGHLVNNGITEDRHKLTGKLSTTLFNRASSTLEGSYELYSKDGRKSSLLSLDGTINWLKSGYQFTARLYYLLSMPQGDRNSWLTTASVSVSKDFYRKFSLTSRINYSRTDRGASVVQLDQYLSWRYGRTYFYLSHYLLKSDTADGKSSMGNVIMLNVQREFRVL